MWTICSLVILPLLSLLGGILGLNSDPKERARNRLILAVLLISALASIAIAVSGHQADATQKKSDDENISFLKQSLTQVLGNTQDIKTLLARVLSGFGVAQARVENIQKNGLASSDDLKLVQEGITGDDLIKTLLAPVQTENQKQQTTVVYYAKDVDPAVVNGSTLSSFGPALISSLLQAGFKPVQTTLGRKNPNLSTNAVWVGQDVPIEQAKFVAYTLMRAGVKIRAIRPFSGTDRKPNEIEIGADQAILNRQPLSYDQIQALQTLSRDLD